MRRADLRPPHVWRRAYLALVRRSRSRSAPQRSLPRALGAIAAAIVLALAAPLAWASAASGKRRPISRPRRRARQGGAAPAADDDDDDGDGPPGDVTGKTRTTRDGAGALHGRRAAAVGARGPARPTWGLAEGDAIAPGRTVLRRLGGGRRYEVFLVWDDHRLAVLVAKVLRPDQATDASALRDLGREAEALARLAHPVIVRGFDAVDRRAASPTC